MGGEVSGWEDWNAVAARTGNLIKGVAEICAGSQRYLFTLADRWKERIRCVHYGRIARRKLCIP